MKIRQGFVSNSSSSSFVFATTIENHNRVLSTMTGDAKTFLENFPFGKGTCFGKDVIVFGDLTGNGGDGSLYWDIEDTCKKTLIKSENVEEVMEDYEKEAKKSKDEFFNWEMG